MANAAHLPALAECPDAELVGLCDLSQERLAATAGRFNIRHTFTDFRRMLDETRPQAVYAILPPHHLYDVAIEVLARGHDLFVEKPPGLTALQTECLARRAAEQKVMTGVGFQRRYHPLFLRCAEEVRRRGPIHQVVATFYKNIPPGVEHPYYRGAIDILTSDVIHVVDAVRFFCGGRVCAVASDVRKLDAWYAVTFNALVAFDSGATGIVLANWRTGKRRLALELHAPGCSAFADADGAGELFADNKAEPVWRLDHAEVAGSQAMHVHQGFLGQARAFLEAVRTRRPVHNDLADAVQTMRLCEAIYAQAINR